MSDLNRHLENDEPEAPEEFVRALRSTQSEPLFIPPTLDEAILREAHQRLSRSRRGNEAEYAPRPRPLIRLITSAAARSFGALPWIATATAIVLAVSFVYLSQRPRFAREDLNHDGKVDILDAFTLARQLKSGAPLKSTLDINGDGVVDSRDFETIALHAVKLDKPGRS